MKKFLKTLSLFILSSVFLVGCSPKVNENNNTPEYDFSEQEITIVCDENNSNDFLYFLTDSPEAEELNKRKSEIEQKYNCKITIQKEENSIDTFVSSKSASNSKGDIDILLSLSYYVRRWAEAGYLVDVADYSEIIDYQDSFRWGTKNDLETGAVNGHLYGLIPTCWPDNIKSFFYIIVTNNKLMKDFGYSDITVYQEEGNWSRETFEEFIANCSQENKGIYSLDTGLESFLTTCIYSGGGEIYDSNSGKTGLRNPGALEGLTWGRNILDKYSDKIHLHDDYRDKFLEGSASMTTGDSALITGKISKNNDIGEFSLLPFPKGPNADENTATGYIHSYNHMISIPQIADDVEASAAVVEALFKPFSTMQNQEQLEEYYRNNIFWSDKDVDILLKENNKAEYNYWQEGFHNVMTSIATMTETTSPASAIEASISAAETIIDKNISENKEGFDLYFK